VKGLEMKKRREREALASETHASTFYFPSFCDLRLFR
jgi:hypothetical protein